MDQEKKRRLCDGKALREEKRRKFQAKQQRQQEQEQTTKAEQEDHPSYVRVVTDKDVQELRQETVAAAPSEMATLLKPYQNLQERQPPGSPCSDATTRRLFVAEGTETVRVLLQQQQQQLETTSSDCQIRLHSVLMKPALFYAAPVRLKDDVETVQHCPDDDKKSKEPISVLLASSKLLDGIAGFSVSRGCLAYGEATVLTETWLERKLEQQKGQAPLRILAMDGICDTANMGSMLRTASAFGIQLVVLSHDCCDPWYRRSVRVSMGHVSRVPIVRVTNLAVTLQTLYQQYNVTSYAADPKQDCLCLHTIQHGAVPDRWCCVVGNESKGVSLGVKQACNYTVRIEMEDAVDSLSVPIAAGILLHGLKEREIQT